MKGEGGCKILGMMARLVTGYRRCKYGLREPFGLYPKLLFCLVRVLFTLSTVSFLDVSTCEGSCLILDSFLQSQ